MSSVTGRKADNIEFAMRSIRQTIATQWLQIKTECDVKKVDPPPNPLQHITEKTTIEHYAAVGAGSKHKAKERLINTT